VLGEAYGAEIKDCKALVKLLNGQLLGRGASKINDAGIVDARETLAQALVLAEKAGLAFKGLSVRNNLLAYEIYAEEGAVLSLGGETLTGEASGSGRVYQGEIALSANGKIELAVTKGAERYSLNLLTPRAGTVVMDGTESTLSQLLTNTQYGSLVEQGEDGVAKVTLSGYDFWKDYDPSVDYGYEYDGDQFNSAYKPNFKFSLIRDSKDLRDVASVEFFVFNAQDEDVTVEIFFEQTKNGVVNPVRYDEIILRANAWTKVTVDNFYLLSLKKNAWKDYTYLGMRVGNLLDDDGKPYGQTFFVDDVMIRYA
jgi:hypothetical protein